jgi:uncharacterized membrane protein YsdA (DUF1294 family)/cold shock CspA family protein
MRGRLTEWNDERGFGFVTSLDDESRAFVHVSEFPHESRRPQILDLITYETRHDDRGRLQARDVQFLAPVRSAYSASLPSSSRISAGRELPLAIPFVALCAVILIGLIVRTSVAAWFLLGYVVMSLVTFAAYAADKSAAARGRFRTQESALHLLELAGGWPGALIAQRVLRHKTKKQSYQIAFWVCVALNLGALAFALSTAPPG